MPCKSIHPAHLSARNSTGKTAVRAARRYFCITSSVGSDVARVDGLNITNLVLEIITPATAPSEELTLNVPSEFTE
jgi:hypothetical protein